MEWKPVTNGAVVVEGDEILGYVTNYSYSPDRPIPEPSNFQEMLEVMANPPKMEWKENVGKYKARIFPFTIKFDEFPGIMNPPQDRTPAIPPDMSDRLIFDTEASAKEAVEFTLNMSIKTLNLYATSMVRKQQDGNRNQA